MDVTKPAFGRQAAVGGLGRIIEADRIPDLGEQPEQGDPGLAGAIENARILDQGLERSGNIGVAGRLAPAQGAGIAAQIRQILSDVMGRGHAEALPEGVKSTTLRTPRPKKSSPWRNLIAGQCIIAHAGRAIPSNEAPRPRKS